HGEAVSVDQASELPTRPRPDRPDRIWPSSPAGSSRSGGGKLAARSAEAAVLSSSSSIRCRAEVSDAAMAGVSGVGTARSGDRYIGCRSVIRDRPHGPTLLRVIRYVT